MIHTETLTARKWLCDCVIVKKQPTSSTSFLTWFGLAQRSPFYQVLLTSEGQRSRSTWLFRISRCWIWHEWIQAYLKMRWHCLTFFSFWWRPGGSRLLLLDLNKLLFFFFAVCSWSIHGTVQTRNHRKQMQNIRFHFHMWRSVMMSRALTRCLASSRVNNIMQNFLFLALPQFPLHVTTADSSCYSVWSGFLYGSIYNSLSATLPSLSVPNSSIPVFDLFPKTHHCLTKNNGTGQRYVTNVLLILRLNRLWYRALQTRTNLKP